MRWSGTWAILSQRCLKNSRYNVSLTPDFGVAPGSRSWSLGKDTSEARESCVLCVDHGKRLLSLSTGWTCSVLTSYFLSSSAPKC